MPHTQTQHQINIPREELQRHYEEAQASGVEVTYEELEAAYLRREHP